MINTQTYPQPHRLRFSVDEYYRMIEIGLLKNCEKAEIIEGELIEKMPIGNKHASIVNNLTKLFIKTVSDDVLVSVQNPVCLTDFTEPISDFVLANLTKYDGKRHPRPNEVLLIVEVSDTTLKYDRDIKLALYAEAEISEVWIVNLPNEIVEVHQSPNRGIYQLTKIFARGEQVESSVLPLLKLEVDKIFE